MARGSFRARVEVDIPDVAGILDIIGVKQMMVDILEPLADEIVKEAKASSAFKDWKKDRPGLRESIRKQKNPDKTYGWLVRAGSKRGAYQSHLVEFGHQLVNSKGETVGMVPEHPFLRPAKEKVISRAVSTLAAGGKWSPGK